MRKLDRETEAVEFLASLDWMLYLLIMTPSLLSAIHLVSGVVSLLF